MADKKTEPLTGEQFMFIRKQTGMTLKEMAVWLGKPGPYTERTIRRWEKGAHPVPPYVKKLFDLAGYSKFLTKMDNK